MVTMEIHMGFIILIFFISLIVFGVWCSNQCQHQYKKIAFRQEEDNHRNMRYSVRTYQCTLCKECVEIDTRYRDPYE